MTDVFGTISKPNHETSQEQILSLAQKYAAKKTGMTVEEIGGIIAMSMIEIQSFKDAIFNN